MADASRSNAGPGKKRRRPAKLPPIDELVLKAKQSFATKSKKESHLVCGWNPYTRKKSNKNTYNAGRQNRRQKKAKELCPILEVNLGLVSIQRLNPCTDSAEKRRKSFVKKILDGAEGMVSGKNEEKKENTRLIKLSDS
ncbi:predicted protein [Nematostella vectensis]|uniref:Uncharacterized protein n=1 Tax=Nematostella vectensis TaxID=45351 RepID=A7S674_NEMVE|nr:predicted protein [Nematostella vectensis]|eukprot:XP_001632878.1 predicted protein [Nematostella vectensis]